VAQRLVEGNQTLQAGFLVRGAVVLAEKVVEQLRGRPGDGRHDPHEPKHDGRTPGADG
jgi:hypothetical protein